MDTTNFQSAKNLAVNLTDAEQLRIVWALLWRLTRASASAINTQRFYNLQRVIKNVCNNAGVGDEQPKTVAFGYYQNVLLTQTQYDELVTEHGQQVVTDAVEQLSSKLNSGEYQTADYLRSCRDFIKTEKLFQVKHGTKRASSKEFIKHDWTPEQKAKIFAERNIDEIEF